MLTRLATALFVFVTLGLAVVIVGVPLETKAADPLCVSQVGSGPAQCLFDIWGYVTYTDGSPVAAAEVTDANRTALADSTGFYDLFVPYTTRVLVRAYTPPPVGNGCYTAVEVINVPQYPQRGYEEDLQLPCAPQ